MPADNSESDCSSLNWEEFFGSSNSELLPCLLSVYDSIAAARKLEEAEPGTERSTADATTEADAAVAKKSSTDEILAIAGDVRDDHRYGVRRSREIASKVPSWCSPSKIDDRSSPRMRPNSCTSATSVSSQWSVCSHESSSGSENSSMCYAENERKSTAAIATADTKGKRFAYDTSGDDNSLRGSTLEPPLRTSCTTESQYSEDSGIYSNFVRSESLHERSWFYADGDDVNYMNRVIQEIVESEFVYVDDLHQVITGYLDEWRNDNGCALSTEQIRDLFGNIEEIYNFHRCFLWELEQCGLDPVKIARCFVENNSNFSLYYVIYCTDYPKSISILTKLMRQDKTAHIFRDRQIRLQHTLPLGSYLLKPVQRITKYHLLLENMVKHASPEMVGYNDLTVALSTMTGIAHHINTMKRRHEHAVRVQEVQSLLTNWHGEDLTTFGELYAEGSFRISGAKASRHIFLFEQMLLVTKKKEAGILNYKTHILCSNLMLVECIPKELLSFQIIPFDNPRMQFTVHARSREEKRYWTLELKRVILENYSVAIPSHARQLVMELGQIQNLQDVSAEKATTKRQYSTPDYLERRKTDKDKRKSVKSRLLPLFRRSESLQSDKMRSDLKKNQSLSESSIFSDNSVSSDKCSLNDSDLQNLSKTTDDLSQACSTVSRTLKGLTTCSVDSGSLSEAIDDTNNPNTEADDLSSYQQKEKLIEEIIGQLLIASQKFQKAIKEHERSVRLKRHSLDASRSFQRSTSADSEDDSFTLDEEDASTPVLKYAKQCRNSRTNSGVSIKETNELNTSSESLSASLRTLVPTSPNVWLKQQREHLATPQKKADSLPRTFQIPEDEWRAVRPKTIASDKPSRMNNMKLFANEETSSSSWLSRKKDSIISIPYFGSYTMHPDCKFYRTSVVRMTFNKMVHTISEKWLTKRGKSERSYKVEHKMRGGCSRGNKYLYTLNKPPDEEKDAKPTIDATYKQGSSDLGARIAHAQEISDYADPRVLFPTITPSKKAASLLGVRVSPTKTQSASEPHHQNEKEDCSLEGFYEKQFEQVEAQFDEAIKGSLQETGTSTSTNADVDELSDLGYTFRTYSKINVRISFHKLIKIPPPVPLKPALLRSISNLEDSSLTKLRSRKMTMSSTVPAETTNIPTRGWVKQVVDRFQCVNE